MDEQKAKELQEQRKRICKDLGCSMRSANCPGDPMCSIILNFIAAPKREFNDGQQILDLACMAWASIGQIGTLDFRPGHWEKTTKEKRG